MRCSFADVIAKKIIQVNLTEKTPKNISIPETEMKIIKKYEFDEKSNIQVHYLGN